jgi:hypothetical protein
MLDFEGDEARTRVESFRELGFEATLQFHLRNHRFAHVLLFSVVRKHCSEPQAHVLFHFRLPFRRVYDTFRAI